MTRLPVPAPDPAEVIRRQLEAYNAHDAAAFAAWYHPEAEVWNLHGAELIAAGRAAIQARYAKSFEQPGRRAEIVGRMLLGGVVVDSERIYTAAAQGFVEALVVYEVQQGLIRRSWIYRILEGS